MILLFYFVTDPYSVIHKLRLKVVVCFKDRSCSKINSGHEIYVRKPEPLWLQVVGIFLDTWSTHIQLFSTIIYFLIMYAHMLVNVILLMCCSVSLVSLCGNPQRGVPLCATSMA